MRTRIREAVLTPARLVLEAIRFVMVWVTVMASPRREVGGVTLVHFGARDDANDHFNKVEVAIDLIRKHARIRLGRYLKRVIVVQSTGSEYWPFASACALSEMTLRTQTPEWVASVLVHETVHARLWRRGVKYEERYRPRIEKICTEAQIRFLRSLPGTQELVDHLFKHLADGWYSDHELDRRRLEKLKSLGAPAWIIGSVARLNRLGGSGDAG